MIDEIAGIPLHKGDLKDNIKKYQSFLDNLPEKTQKKIERFFIMGIAVIICILVFLGGMMVGFERKCSIIRIDTQNQCNEYICEKYDYQICSIVDGKVVYKDQKQEYTPLTDLINIE